MEAMTEKKKSNVYFLRYVVFDFPYTVADIVTCMYS